LSARRIRDIERFAASTADRLWRENVYDGQIEWMSAMANRLPMMVVARLIGIPDDDVDQLIRWAYATTTLLDGIVAADQLQAAGLAAMELGGYVSERFEQAATNPAENLLCDLASRCASDELDQIAALGMMLILFGAGGESTASLLGSATWILATHPEIQREVRDNPELLGPFIEEALRYEPPFRGHYRHVRNATSLAGVELPADSHLLLMWGAANRDPDHFESPDEFRLDRRMGKGHITFGKGAHFCVGAALARLEAQIVLGQLLERTSKIEAAETGRWLPSLLVRRLEHLKLAVK
jgi:cytochrome P450